VSTSRTFSQSESFRDAPLPASGLPPRILAALRAAGAARLGDLCQPLPAPLKLDAGDQALLERVAVWCRAACHGRPTRLHLLEWLALFLPARLADALALHCGLHDPAAAIALHECKLRDTAFKLGVTRERARQLVGLALDALRQTLPLFAAEPLFRAAEAALHAAGGVLEAADLARRTDPDWGGASPVGAFLLLTQLLPGRIVRYRDFFSEFSDTQIERAEKALRDRLALAQGLLPVAEIAAGETPLRTLVETFNARLQPECRRGSGYVRDALHRDPRIRKTAPGRYALPGGIQTGLPL
jgi:hypothetical protein